MEATDKDSARHTQGAMGMMRSPLVLGVGLVSLAASLACGLIAHLVEMPLMLVVLVSLVGAIVTAGTAGVLGVRIYRRPIAGLVAWAHRQRQNPEVEPPPQTGSAAIDEIVDALSVLLERMRDGASAVRRAETIRREFVGNVSHELRTPIASLKALVETLEEGALEDPPAAREFLEQMHVEVDSLAQLVHELLELSRIESGEAPICPERVEPVELLEQAARRLRRQAERAHVTVDIVAEPDVPWVWADPSHIERVLINLLHNAIKFTPKEGRITLTARPQAKSVRILVADNGIGIEAKDLPRLFERFYKVDRSRASGGTGLGLAIAKHIVQAHGGQIWAESRGEGKGSTFAFTLPVAA
ncbi:MAG TPA: ATP-binding protein [Chloroflexota bacterium]|nr:ATP-binding protein [Chloroflexota bacterium]